jgi:HTH-type transcriptional regulator / antitoxin HigA
MTGEDFLEEFRKILNTNEKGTGQRVTLRLLFEEKLEQSGITQNQAEDLLGMEKRTLEGILDRSTKKVDVVNLLKLGEFLGLDYAKVIALFMTEASQEASDELDATRKKSYIVSNFDIKTLSKAKFLQTKSNFDEIEQRIKSFFGITTIYDYSKGTYIPAFSKTKRTASQLMQEFWVRSAVTLFEKLNNPNDYDRDALIELIPKIRPYTMNVANGLKTVTQALYNVGVTVIYQPHLPLTQVRGATFIIKDRPCIVITDLNKNYATLWFALLHELAHVLFDYDQIEKQVFHLTGEADLFLLQEDAANDFARDYLLSQDKLKYVQPHINNNYIVEQMAKEFQIHPSIIYSIHCYDVEAKGLGSYWGLYGKYIPSTKVALDGINVNPFENSTLEETVKYLKANVYNF